MNSPKLPNHPVLIVDIDETILDTNRRKIAILNDLFGIEITLDQAQADYSLSNYLRSPEQIHNFFHEFHSGKYLALDTPIPHAAETLHRLNAKVRIVYLTGRHAQGIQPWMAQEPATLHSLQRFGFPLPNDDGVMLVMKPSFAGFESIEKQSATDRAHKILVVSELVTHQHVLAGIGDTFTDLWVYSTQSVFPICLRRPHWSQHFADRIDELPIRPFIADDWLEIETKIQELAKQTN